MGMPHTLRGSMPGGDTALDDAMEVNELGSNPLTALQFHMHSIRTHGNSRYNITIIFFTSVWYAE